MERKKGKEKMKIKKRTKERKGRIPDQRSKGRRRKISSKGFKISQKLFKKF